MKDSRGVNILQVVAGDKKIEVYDFNSNSRILIWAGFDLKISSPVKFFETATGGVMITGFNSSVVFSNSGWWKKTDIFDANKLNKQNTI